MSYSTNEESRCRKSSCFTLTVSVIYLVLGAAVSVFGGWTLSRNKSVLSAFFLLVGLYVALTGLIGVLSHGKSLTLKSLHLFALSINTLFLAAGLLVVIIDFSGMSKKFFNTERQAARTSSAVIARYDAADKYRPAVIGGLAALTALSVLSFIVGCRSRLTLSKNDELRNEHNQAAYYNNQVPYNQSQPYASNMYLEP